MRTAERLLSNIPQRPIKDLHRDQIVICLIREDLQLLYAHPLVGIAERSPAVPLEAEARTQHAPDQSRCTHARQTQQQQQQIHGWNGGLFVNTQLRQNGQYTVGGMQWRA